MGKGLGKFLAGAAIGAGLGILFAPKKGSETRQELKAKFDELMEKAKNVDLGDIKDQIEDKINDIKKELEDLDKEKVIKIAKKKSREILKKADELVKLAIEKGTPVVQRITKEAKEKTVEVLEDIIFKLEKENTKTTK